MHFTEHIQFIMSKDVQKPWRRDAGVETSQDTRERIRNEWRKTFVIPPKKCHGTLSSRLTKTLLRYDRVGRKENGTLIRKSNANIDSTNRRKNTFKHILDGFWVAQRRLEKQPIHLYRARFDENGPHWSSGRLVLTKYQTLAQSSDFVGVTRMAKHTHENLNEQAKVVNWARRLNMLSSLLSTDRLYVQ